MPKPPGFQPYKFRDLRVYTSKEWLADNKKRYRKVFDRSEVSYIYAEFSFYNKLFDEGDWDFLCEIRAFSKDDREICKMPVARRVRMEENVVYIREGWGMDKPGAFWKPGHYRWEVWVGEQKLATEDFHVLDDGVVNTEDNPYLEVNALRLYEADHDDKPENERQYYRVFSREETRYVWAEFVADNLLCGVDSWPCELSFNFYTNTGQLKGSVHELIAVGVDDDEIRCTVGWGASKPGTWYRDSYRVEVVFMDQVIAAYAFEVADTFEVAEAELFYVPCQGMPSNLQPGPAGAWSDEEDVANLEDLIGLQTIKEKIEAYTTYLNFLQVRARRGLEAHQPINLNAVFLGNPGTGKTTVAKLLGKLYHRMGMLSRGHVHVVDRSDLVGEFIGQTAPKTKEAIKKARGGILFVDEAYSLARKGDDTKDFGKEVIEILIKEMSDGEGDLAIIGAGYPEEMRNFLESNPGLKSRFNQVYEFPDYTPDELLQIAGYAARQRNVSFAPAAEKYLHKKLIDAYRSRERSFGNARLVNNWVDQAKMNMGLRLMREREQEIDQLSRRQLSTIRKSDIEVLFDERRIDLTDIPVDENLLSATLSELQGLIGLGKVKAEITELVQLVRYYREMGKNPQQEFSLHAILKGNPGTGKTTVARIMASLYKALGILEKGHLVECDRQKLVAGYLGQTAEKTNEVIDSALGGVLFIDEAYTLINGEGDTFGKEAVATLLKRMEDDRGRFIVMVAGYTNNMEQFLISNPGLKSRFDRSFNFEDFNVEEMVEIALAMFKTHELTPEKAARSYLYEYFQELEQHQDKFFGNGRTVRKFVEQAIRQQYLRLARLAPEDRNARLRKRIRLEDLKGYTPEEVADAPARIGFNRQLGSRSSGH